MSDCLETHVQAFYLVRECADGNEIHSALRVLPYVAGIDAARRFHFCLPADGLDRFSRKRRGEIVEEDPLHTAARKDFTDIRERARLDLYGELFLSLRLVFVNCVDGSRDAASKVDVII